MKIISVLGKIKRKGKQLHQSALYHWNKLKGVRIDHPPVFIVGCGHSGTWLLLAILGAHSKIFAVPYESLIATKDDEQAFRMATQKFDRMTIAAGKHRWVEKTPRHILHIDRILTWCPDARIVLIIRDGRDVARSISERFGSLEKAIHRWVLTNRAGEKYWNHPNVFVLRYEDIVTNFDDTVRKILSFLNEEYEPNMRLFYKYAQNWSVKKVDNTHKEISTNNKEYRMRQITQPIFDSRGRWKALSKEELELVYSVGGDLLSELGYVTDLQKSFPDGTPLP